MICTTLFEIPIYSKIQHKSGFWTFHKRYDNPMRLPKGLKHAVHLDDTVKRLISDKSLVTDVQLQQSRWVSPVQDCFIRARPKI